MKRVFLYLRVSTEDQSCELQLSELSDYVARQDWIISGVFEDKLCGTTTNRPSLKEMNSRLWKKETDIVIVYKLDRIFRSLSDCIYFLQDWSNRGIDFVSLKDPGLNMATPTGRLMIHNDWCFCGVRGKSNVTEKLNFI